jgi:hypothetical protein
LPIVLANSINIYPSLAALKALEFTTKEITVISTMILLCHSLPIETVVAKKAGSKGWMIIAMRASAAVLAGLVLNLVWGG